MYEGSEQGVSWATMWEGELTPTLTLTPNP